MKYFTFCHHLYIYVSISYINDNHMRTLCILNCLFGDSLHFPQGFSQHIIEIALFFYIPRIIDVTHNSIIDIFSLYYERIAGKSPVCLVWVNALSIQKSGGDMRLLPIAIHGYSVLNVICGIVVILSLNDLQSVKQFLASHIEGD